MNISYSWLQDYLPYVAQETPDEVARVLTSIGLEVGGVEQVEAVRGGLRGVVVGHVLTCVPHPNSDHLHVCTVDVGNCSDEPLQIVCGAPNVDAGQMVLVATVGTTLYSGDESFKIKKSKLRGEVSMGMICSQVELGLGEDNSGIWVLDDPNACPGTPAADYLKLHSNTLIEVDITPNRVDATSHFGVARDLAAYYSFHTKSPMQAQLPDLPTIVSADRAESAIKVSVEVSESDCPRYQGATIRGIKNQESPEWLQQRLLSIGMHPINAVVDITNFVLHEVGQPLHAFDAKMLPGNTIRVAHLPEATLFTTLDEVEHKLTGRENMICDDQLRPLCLGGVMGGLEAGVTMETTDLFIESANFNPTTTRRAARSHGLSSDSSFRFERGLDPEATDWALRRAVSLILEICGGELVAPMVDEYRQPSHPTEITLSHSYLCRMIGKEISREELLSILTALEMHPQVQSDDEIALSVPRYRYDVTRPVDVIEEVLRIYGYNAIPLSGYIHANLATRSEADRMYQAELRISELLTGLGYHEILNNSLTSHRYYAAQHSFAAEHLVPVENPLSQELDVLRPTLLVGGLETIARNLNRQQPLCAFYEWGNTYNYDAARPAGTPLDRYSYTPKLGLWLTGSFYGNSWTQAAQPASFFMLRGAVDKILAHIGFSDKRLSWSEQSEQHDAYAESISYKTPGGDTLVTIGVVSDYWLKQCDVSQPVYYAEIDMEVLKTLLLSYKVESRELSKFPTVKRDLALLIDESIRYEELVQTALKAERKLLKRVELFDVYTGKELPTGKKSYALSFYLRDDNATLRDTQIDSAMKRIQEALQQAHGAALR